MDNSFLSQSEMTPSDRFLAWVKANPAKIQELKAQAGGPVVEKTIRRLADWLVRYQHSPRSNKKNWYRFLVNNTPKGGKVVRKQTGGERQEGAVRRRLS